MDKMSFCYELWCVRGRLEVQWYWFLQNEVNIQEIDMCKSLGIILVIREDAAAWTVRQKAKTVSLSQAMSYKSPVSSMATVTTIALPYYITRLFHSYLEIQPEHEHLSGPRELFHFKMRKLRASNLSYPKSQARKRHSRNSNQTSSEAIVCFELPTYSVTGVGTGQEVSP